MTHSVAALPNTLHSNLRSIVPEAFTPVLGEHTKKLELRRTSTQSAEPQGSCLVMWPLGLGSICGRGRFRWPSFWTAILVHDQRGRTCRQYLKGLQKFNDLVLLVLG